jgi:hypothetical protein
MKKIGILGFSEGNGHPFSFAAIINGFDKDRFGAAGWPIIHDYMMRRPAEDFGIDDLSVTHVWMPQPEMATTLSNACNVETVVNTPDKMMEQLDAVIIARDDAESHMSLARPFLEHGLSVFIDKPLTLNEQELDWFMPYVLSGKLMSCAGLRYAVELDPVRNGQGDYGGIRSIRCAVTNDWDRYGIHMIDAAFTLTKARPRKIRRLEATKHESYFMEMDDGSTLLIETHGQVGPLFNVSVIGQGKVSTHDLRDNFSSFRRLLHDFSKMLQTGEPPIPPYDVELSIRTVIAGKLASPGGEAIPIPQPKHSKPS